VRGGGKITEREDGEEGEERHVGEREREIGGTRRVGGRG
jgi:hypothetical protein